MLQPQAKKQLYVCFDRGSQEIFYASMVNQKGALAEMRSSTDVESGAVLCLKPVPPDWDGKPISQNEIVNTPQTMEANVIRKEGRNSFHIRILSYEAQDVANRIRTGQISEDKLKIDASEAGLIYSVRVEGRIALEAATKLKAYLGGLSLDHKLILLDLTGLLYLDKNCVGMLIVGLKDIVKQGRIIAILVKSDTLFEEMLLESKISAVAEVHTSRDEAVASLLRRTFSG